VPDQIRTGDQSKKKAKAIGLTIPESFLLGADEIIE
jgi:hypothetical protein